MQPEVPKSAMQSQSKLHIQIRSLAVAGIAVLALHYVQRKYLPGLLPVTGWHPNSQFRKWLGISIDALGLFVLLGTLFMSAIWTYVAFVNSRAENNQLDCWIDLFFVVALYLALALS
jgi:hypothetical protein